MIRGLPRKGAVVTILFQMNGCEPLRTHISSDNPLPPITADAFLQLRGIPSCIGYVPYLYSISAK